MWAAVVVAVVASAGNNIGKVLQKQATGSLPRLSLDNKVLKAYLRNALWLTGLVVDLLGAVLMLEAVAHAPVSVVQPVSGCGMAVMAVFSHLYLKEPMSSRDWLGVALAAAGTLGVGFCSESGKEASRQDPQQQQQQQQLTQQTQLKQNQQQQQQLEQHRQMQQQAQQGHTQGHLEQIEQQHQQQQQQQQHHEAVPQLAQQPRISPLGLFAFLVVILLILMSCEAWLSSRSRSKRRHNPRDAPQSPSKAKAEVLDEVLAGCQAGCCFGLSAAAVKTGFLLSSAAAAATAAQQQKLLSGVAEAAALGAGTGTGVVTGIGLGSGTGAGVSLPIWVAHGGVLWGIAGIGCGVALSSSGFFCQTRGFKEGRAVVVSTCAAVSSIVTAVFGGMVALGETLPHSSINRTILLFSWLLILGGIVFLVGDKAMTPTFDTLRPPQLRGSFGSRKISSAPRNLAQGQSPPPNNAGRKHEA